MQKDCAYYLSARVAEQILLQDDPRQKDLLFNCLQSWKPFFYSRVGHQQSNNVREMLENAYDETCVVLLENAANGKLHITGATITGYFFGIFRNKVIDMYKAEAKFLMFKKMLGKTADEKIGADEFEMIKKVFSDRTEKTLETMGGTNCRELLILRYALAMDYDQIIAKRNNEITRKAAIAMVHECKKKFRSVWEKLQ